MLPLRRPSCTESKTWSGQTAPNTAQTKEGGLGPPSRIEKAGYLQAVADRAAILWKVELPTS